MGLVHLVARYSERALDASLIEVQKLMYFLQVAGAPLRLRFEKGIYGPYADNLRFSLLAVEEHFLTGFGDGSGSVTTAEPLIIIVIAGAEDEAAEALAGRCHVGRGSSGRTREPVESSQEANVRT